MQQSAALDGPRREHDDGGVKFVVAVALLLAGCATDPPPGWTPPDEIAPPSDAQSAIDIALDFYAGIVDIPAPIASVHWTLDPLILDVGEADGVTFGCNEIWVRIDASSSRIPYTLAHELGHCMLRTMHGNDGDHEHTLVEWWGNGGLVDRAHVAVRAAGL